jgi:hypothetical protein
VSFDAPERGEKVRGVEEWGEASPRGCCRKSAACLHGLRRAIWAAWRLRLRRERGGAREGSRGFIGAALVASYGASNAGEVTPVNVTGRGREGEWWRWWQVGSACRWEREGERGWADSARAGWAGWLPGSAQLGFWPLLFIFFSCFLFSLFWISVLSFWKSSLIQIWMNLKLTTFGPLNVCLETKPEV